MFVPAGKTASCLMIALCMAAILVGCGETETPPPVVSPSGDKARIIAFWKKENAAKKARIEGDCAKAIGLYREALRYDPDHEDSRYYLGHCLVELARFGEAKSEFEAIIEKNKDSSRAEGALGLLYCTSGPLFDLAKAEKHLLAARRINPAETGRLTQLGAVEFLLGEKDKAQESLAAAASGNPNNWESRILLFYLASKADRREQAARWLSDAREGCGKERKVGKEPLFGDLCREVQAGGSGKEVLEAVRSRIQELRQVEEAS